MKKRDGRLVRKTSAAITAACFIAQQIFAPAVSSASEVQESSLRVPSIEIPAEIGSLETSGILEDQKPMIIQVQDAHGNYDAQKNIQKILQHLTAYEGVDLVLLEGGKGPLHPEILNFLPRRPDLNLEIADRLAQQSELSGAEIFLLDRYLAGKTLAAFGIENAPAYRENREAFQKVLRAREQSGNFLKDMEMQIDRLTAPHVNPQLKNFLRSYEAYESRQMDLTVWLRQLEELSRKHLGLDLDLAGSQKDWPMLTRYSRLRKLEPKLDKTRVENDKTAMLQKLRSLNVSKAVIEAFDNAVNMAPDNGVQASQIVKAVESVMEAVPSDFSFEPYGFLKAWIQFEVFQRELNGEALFAEVSKLEDLLSNQLARTETEKKLLALFKDYRALNKLFALELTREDYQNIQRSEDTMTPSAIAGRFSAVNKNKQVRDTQFIHLKELDALYSLALNFYRGALDRDHLMADNILETMQAQGKRRAVVVTGGFHSEGMQEYFQSKGFSYARISPRIQELGDNKAYIRAMLDEDVEIKKSQVADILVEQFGEVQLELGSASHLTRKDAVIYRVMRDVVEHAGARSEMRGRRDWIYGIGLVTAIGLAAYAAFRPLPVNPPAQQDVPAKVAELEPKPVQQEKKVEEKKPAPIPEVVPLPQPEKKAPIVKIDEPVIDKAETLRVWGKREVPKISPEKLEALVTSDLNAEQIRYLLKYDKRSKQLESAGAGKNTVWSIEAGVRHITEAKLNKAEKAEFEATKGAIEEFLKELKEDGAFKEGQTALDLYYFFFRPLFVVQDRHGAAAAKWVVEMQIAYFTVKNNFEINLKGLTEKSLSATYIRTIEDYLNADEWKANGGERLKIAFALSILYAQMDNYKQVIWRNHDWSKFKRLELPAELELYRFYGEKGLGKDALERMELELKAEIRGPRPLGKNNAWNNRPNLPQRYVGLYEEVYSRTWYYSTMHRERFYRPGDFRLGATPNPWFPTHTLMYFHISRMDWVQKRASDVTGVSREPYFIAPVAIQLPSDNIRKNKFPIIIPARPDAVWGAMGLGDRSSQRAEDIFSFHLSNPSAWKPGEKDELQYLDQVFDAAKMKDFSKQFRALWDSGKVRKLYVQDYGEFLVDDFLKKFIDQNYFDVFNGQLKGNEKYFDDLAKALRTQYPKLPYDYQVYLQIPLLRYEAGKNLKLDDDYMAYLRADLYQSAAQLARDIYVNNTQALIGSAYRQGIYDTPGVLAYVERHIIFRPMVEKLLGRELVLSDPHSNDSGRLSAFVNEIYKRDIDPDIWYLITRYTLEESTQKSALEFYNAVMGTELTSLGLNDKDEKLAAVRFGVLLSYAAEDILHPGRMEKIKTFLKTPAMRRKAVEFAIRTRGAFRSEPDLTGDDLKRAADALEKDLLEQKNSEALVRYTGYLIGQARTAVLKDVLDSDENFKEWVELTDALIKVLDPRAPKKRSEARAVSRAPESFEADFIEAFLNSKLMDLTDRERVVFTRRFAEKKKVNEIAAELKIAGPAVSKVIASLQLKTDYFSVNIYGKPLLDPRKLNELPVERVGYLDQKTLTAWKGRGINNLKDLVTRMPELLDDPQKTGPALKIVSQYLIALGVNLNLGLIMDLTPEASSALEAMTLQEYLVQENAYQLLLRVQAVQDPLFLPQKKREERPGKLRQLGVNTVGDLLKVGLDAFRQAGFTSSDIKLIAAVLKVQPAGTSARSELRSEETKPEAQGKAVPVRSEVLQRVRSLKTDEVEKLTTEDLAGIVRELVESGILKDYEGLQVLLTLFSAGPATGKGALMSATFLAEEEGEIAPYQDLVDKFVLFHTRAPRVDKKGRSEKNGRAYYFVKTEDLKQLAAELGEDVLVVREINREVQALARKNFTLPHVEVGEVTGSGQLQPGDLVVSFDASQGLLVIQRGEFTIPLTGVTIPEGSAGYFLNGDKIEKVEGPAVYVSRQIKGIEETFKSGKLTILEGGYEWFKWVKEHYPEVLTMFLSPFREPEFAVRAQNLAWIRENFSTPEDIYAAFEAMTDLIKANKGEISIPSSTGYQAAIKAKVDSKPAIPPVLAENTAVILNDADFIAELNQLRSRFGKPSLKPEDYDLARALAFEVQRRLFGRDGVKAFRVGGERSNPYDRILEGTLQILDRNSDYGAENVLPNPFGYTEDEKSKNINELSDQFARRVFLHVVEGLRRSEIRNNPADITAVSLLEGKPGTPSELLVQAPVGISPRKTLRAVQIVTEVFDGIAPTAGILGISAEVLIDRISAGESGKVSPWVPFTDEQRKQLSGVLGIRGHGTQANVLITEPVAGIDNGLLALLGEAGEGVLVILVGADDQQKRIVAEMNKELKAVKRQEIRLAKDTVEARKIADQYTKGKTVMRAYVDVSMVGRYGTALRKQLADVIPMTPRMYENMKQGFAAAAARLTAFFEISKRIKSAA